MATAASERVARSRRASPTTTAQRFVPRIRRWIEPCLPARRRSPRACGSPRGR